MLNESVPIIFPSQKALPILNGNLRVQKLTAIYTSDGSSADPRGLPSRTALYPDPTQTRTSEQNQPQSSPCIVLVQFWPGRRPRVGGKGDGQVKVSWDFLDQSIEGMSSGPRGSHIPTTFGSSP